MPEMRNPDRHHGAASVESRVTPGHLGARDGHLKDDVLAPNTLVGNFRAAVRVDLPAVSVKGHAV
jgi:hypothetical protein